MGQDLKTSLENKGYKVSERVKLEKFDGDVSEQDLPNRIPVEILIMEDGVQVDHWVKGEDPRDPTEVV